MAMLTMDGKEWHTVSFTIKVDHDPYFTRDDMPDPHNDSGQEHIIIQSAIDLLTKGGWAKNAFRSGDAVCLEQALAVGAGQDLMMEGDVDHWCPFTEQLVRKVVNNLYHHNYQALRHFNDEDVTSLRDVMQALLVAREEALAKNTALRAREIGKEAVDAAISRRERAHYLAEA